MNKFSNYAAFGMLSIFCVIIFLFSYSIIWEARQPKLTIQTAIVKSIEYNNFTNDLHLSSTGYIVHINGEKNAINFSSKSWDDSIKVGEIINIVVKRSFPWFGLKKGFDGIKVDGYR